MFAYLVARIAHFFSCIWLFFVSLFRRKPSEAESEDQDKPDIPASTSLSNALVASKPSFFWRLIPFSNASRSRVVVDDEESHTSHESPPSQPIQTGTTNPRRIRVLSVSPLRPEIFIEDWCSLGLTVSEFNIPSLNERSGGENPSGNQDQTEIGPSRIVISPETPAFTTPTSSVPTSPEITTPLDSPVPIQGISTTDMDSSEPVSTDSGKDSEEKTMQQERRRSHEYVVPSSVPQNWTFESAVCYDVSPLSARTTTTLWDSVSSKPDLDSVPLPLFTSTPPLRSGDPPPELKVDFGSETDFSRYSYFSPIPYADLFDFNMYNSGRSAAEKTSILSGESSTPSVLPRSISLEIFASSPGPSILSAYSPDKVKERDLYRPAAYSRRFPVGTGSAPTSPTRSTKSETGVPEYSKKASSSKRSPIPVERFHEFLAESPKDLREALLARLQEMSDMIDNSQDWDLISTEGMSERLREACMDRSRANWTHDEFLKIIGGKQDVSA
ncbi:hypothetical protein BDN72DRAFT_834927 [Pluteus cervinus]|uniref:Uncharacterized protein n=1 Tax=Pluteus cervinus TaxID=181527 RepID=A0ACD3B6F9_9AGAR|nr:hypothetical protein BDN72DRAFT_834927 [Pluteus cervinus]